MRLVAFFLTKERVMVLLNSAGAKIRLILATRDLKESQPFIRDVEKSKVSYLLQHVADASAVDLAITEAVSPGTEMATVVVLDHALTSDLTEEIAARVKKLSAGFPVECVVVNPPPEPHARKRLASLGATLFDEAASAAGIPATFH